MTDEMNRLRVELERAQVEFELEKRRIARRKLKEAEEASRFIERVGTASFTQQGSASGRFTHSHPNFVEDPRVTVARFRKTHDLNSATDFHPLYVDDMLKLLETLVAIQYPEVK